MGYSVLVLLYRYVIILYSFRFGPCRGVEKGLIAIDGRDHR